jgi:flagellar motor component MotA
MEFSWMSFILGAVSVIAIFGMSIFFFALSFAMKKVKENGKQVKKTTPNTK